MNDQKKTILPDDKEDSSIINDDVSFENTDIDPGFSPKPEEAEGTQTETDKKEPTANN